MAVRNCYAIPDKRKQGVGQPVEPAEVRCLATGPGEIHPDVKKLVNAKPRDEVDFESAGLQVSPPDVVAAFEPHDIPAKWAFGNDFAARFVRNSN